MMSTAPPLSLTHQQAHRFHGCLERYRCLVLTTHLPSPERNSALRVLQSIQGKLIALLDQHTTPLALVLTSEELTMGKAAILQLLHLIGQQPATPERNMALADLVDIKVILFRST